MNNKPISVGDMVMVVKRKPCCGQGYLGFPFVVKAIICFQVAVCMHCGDRHIDDYALDEKGDVYLMSRLQRIPPVAEQAKVTIKAHKTKELVKIR